MSQLKNYQYSSPCDDDFVNRKYICCSTQYSWTHQSQNYKHAISLGMMPPFSFPSTTCKPIVSDNLTGLHTDVRWIDDRFVSLYEMNKQAMSQTLQKCVSDVIGSGKTKYD